MDKASLIGIIVGVVCLGICAYEVSHGHFMMFYSLEGILMVGGGSISVCFMAMPMDKMKCVPGYIKRFMFEKGRSATEVVQAMAGLGEKARRDGILEPAKVAHRFGVERMSLIGSQHAAEHGVRPQTRIA